MSLGVDLTKRRARLQYLIHGFERALSNRIFGPDHLLSLQFAYLSQPCNQRSSSIIVTYTAATLLSSPKVAEASGGNLRGRSGAGLNFLFILFVVRSFLLLQEGEKKLLPAVYDLLSVTKGSTCSDPLSPFLCSNKLTF